MSRYFGSNATTFQPPPVLRSVAEWWMWVNIAPPIAVVAPGGEPRAILVGGTRVHDEPEPTLGKKINDEIVEHMAQDPLVGWGWHPDAGRSPVPGTQEEFGALIKAWVDTGAGCPKS